MGAAALLPGAQRPKQELKSWGCYRREDSAVGDKARGNRDTRLPHQQPGAKSYEHSQHYLAGPERETQKG